MKTALRWIPTEVWVDVFCCIFMGRKILGPIVDRIGNHKFAEFLQFFLHDWSKRTLGELCFDKETIHDIPQTPMPEKINTFQKIIIKHFDAQTPQFMRQIGTLLREVNLNFVDFDYIEFQYDLTTLRTILDHILPLLHGIHAIGLTSCAIPLMGEQHFAWDFAQVKMLSFYVYEDEEEILLDPAIIQPAINFCTNWLTSVERDSSEPRLLEVFAAPKATHHFSNAIQQQFLSAKTPCTFSVKLSIDDFVDPGFMLENAIGEQLHGQTVYFGQRRVYFEINRHQANSGQRLEEWVEETNAKSDKRWIQMGIPLTTGQIEAIAGDVDDGENEEDGPSTSKKRKLAA